MKRTSKQALIATLIITLILAADQILKIWVKTHMQLGDEIPLIGNWCILHFTENVGMAFGMAFFGNIGKFLLTLFRIIASAGVMWALVHYIRKGTTMLFVVSVSLIFVGAIGNLVDSCFYGLIFNESYYNVAQLFPPEGGYAPFFFGRVVDMFYFPLFEFDLPWGGHFLFFNAIFNIADAAICVGVALFAIYLLINKKKNQDKAVVNEES